MNFKELQEVLDDALSDSLAGCGFLRAAPGTWNRRRGAELNVIQLQKHSEGTSFCVNLGVHYTFLPLPGSGALPVAGDRLDAHDCELKFRLTNLSANKDQWWPIAASSVVEVLSLTQSRTLPLFDSYCLNGPIASMSGAAIERGDTGLLATLTKGGACLLIARMHEHLGDAPKAIEAANIGLELSGRMASGLRKTLKDLLIRLGQPS